MMEYLGHAFQIVPFLLSLLGRLDFLILSLSYAYLLGSGADVVTPPCRCLYIAGAGLQFAYIVLSQSGFLSIVTVGVAQPCSLQASEAPDDPARASHTVLRCWLFMNL